MMIMMKKKLHTTHTHKYIWCIFLEISKWGGSREWCEEPGKDARARARFIFLENSNWV